MNIRVSQLWNDRPWRRKGQSTAQNTTQEEPTHGDNGFAAAIERRAKRLSRLWKNDTNEPPVRRHSIKPLKPRRSFFRPNDEPTLVEDNTAEVNDAPPLERETLLKKIRRKSQNFSLQRPSTSTGVPKRRSFFGTTDLDLDDGEVPPVPTLLDLQGFARPRHVPITIDTPEYTNEQPPPVTGMAITSNDVQSANHAFAEKPTRRPVSSSSNFSQIRTRAARTTFHSPPQATPSDSSDDEDILTALPSMDFKEFSVGELRSPVVPAVVQVDRKSMSFRRVTPKVVDIIAPRPLSMFSGPPARKQPGTKERPKTMTGPPTASLIGAVDEDGPKGDWSRTRNSWVGFGEGESEQLEWDKLKQFMEAYGNGQDGGIISVRAVGTDSSDSSDGQWDSNGMKHSNAQALAALEFGLT